MTVYTLQYEITPELQRRAMMPWTKQSRSPADKRWRILFGVIGYLAFLGMIVALLQFDLIDAKMMIAAGLGFIAGLVIWGLTYRAGASQITGFANDALARHGPVRAIFTAEQVQLTTELSSSTMGWRCFDTVIALPDATVLRAGALVYPVPDTALSPDTLPQAFRTDINNWIGAAR